ncbi:MAG: glycosyltransferase family 2 protein, partial [Anaerolineales bacterium]|nr:glycosyltransferase family 2 protein [Anaerolineales bacterium]
PALNEETAVAREVETIHDILRPLGVPYEIIVVDDGSHDQTAAEAARAHAHVLRHPENRGYGASLKSGIRAAQYNTIVITDADGTYPPEEIPRIVALLAEADMVVGARIGESVHIPWLRRPAKALLRWLATYIAEHPIPDLNSGLRAFHRDCITQYFPILSNRFSFTTTSTLALLADDYHVVYHPINYHKRIGKSKINPRHFMDFTILILRMSMMFQPLKVFIPLSFIFGILGLLKSIFDIITLFFRAQAVSTELLYAATLSTSAILLLMVGLQFLLIGMVADGVVRRIGQHNRPPVPSRGVRGYQTYSTPPAAEATERFTEET